MRGILVRRCAKIHDWTPRDARPVDRYTLPPVEDAPPVRLLVDAAQGVGAALRASLPEHARRRGIVLLVHGRGPAEPWCPSPATLADVVATAVDLGIAARWAAIGRAPGTTPALLRIAGPEGDRRTLGVQLAGNRCELPRAWVGRHALLLSPAVFDARPGAAGPFAAGLAALAVAAHAAGLGQPLEVGAALLARVFAGFTWVLDARCALVQPRRPSSRALAGTPARVFVHGATGLDEGEVARRARAIDAWAEQRRVGPTHTLELVGPMADDPWPLGPSEALGVDGPSWPPRQRARGREVRRP
jgi:hypothetical protein